VLQVKVNRLVERLTDWIRGGARFNGRAMAEAEGAEIIGSGERVPAIAAFVLSRAATGRVDGLLDFKVD
jgi:hypothetical protein